MTAIYYRVKPGQHVTHDGEGYAPGDLVKLDDKAAQALLNCDAVDELDEQPIEPQAKPTKAKKAQADESADEQKVEA